MGDARRNPRGLNGLLELRLRPISPAGFGMINCPCGVKSAVAGENAFMF